MNLKRVREFTLFFSVQFLLYAAVCWNWRAVANARYIEIALSDAVFATLTFSMLKKIGEATTAWARIGYVVGGILGSLTSVWVTKRLWGQ